ncbi:DNA (cytosine-5-)-methyltransferase [Timonella senegalensis]|uniref:DNA (cytosine-5-)-methyltransferase n=1 Tax=Timonella senegalensis TaxID=1465825 RepID=UPI002FDC8A64
MTDAQTFTYADLFAGIGGFAAVLRGMGGQHAYAVEIDKPAAAVYERVWGHSSLGDITKDATDELVTIPQHDIVAGGFPCQPFSKSGAQKGMDEIRGTLFFNIMENILHNKPTLFVLENVRNLVGPRHRHEWEVIIDRLQKAGYQVSETPAIFSPHMIDPAFGGAPQVRERVFITGTLVPEGHVADPHVAPVALPAHVKMNREWNLEHDLPLLDDEDPRTAGTALSADEEMWIDHWEEWVQVLREMRARDADKAGETARRLPGHPIWANVWTVDKKKRDVMWAEAPAWKRDSLQKNWDLYDAMRERCDKKWLTRWLRKTRTFPESRQKLEWQAQDETELWSCVISLRPSGLRAKRMTHLPALVAITQTPIIGPRKRRLAPREAARLQGLPDSFDFGDQRDALTYKQLGNGVNVGVVWNVLKAHVERDRELLLATEKGRTLYSAISGAPARPPATMLPIAESELAPIPSAL